MPTSEVVHFEDASAAFSRSSLQLGAVDLPKVLLDQELSEKVAHSRIDPKYGLVGDRLKGKRDRHERFPLRQTHHSLTRRSRGRLWRRVLSSTRTNCSSACSSMSGPCLQPVRG
jgi:hypothetical protein